jgi:hypothetical protein
MDKGLHLQAKQGKDLLQEEKGHLLEKDKSHHRVKGLLKVKDHLPDNKAIRLHHLQGLGLIQNALPEKMRMTRISTTILNHGLLRSKKDPPTKCWK